MADEFDTLFEAAPSRPRDEFDDVFSGPQLAPLELKVQDGVAGSPQQAGEVLKASRAVGEPYGLSKTAPAETIARAKGVAAKEVLLRNPFIQDEVRDNPAFADVAGDDWGVLDKLSKAWDFNTTYNPIFALARNTGAVSAGVKKGIAAEQQGLAKLFGDVEGAKEYEAYIAGQPQYAGGVPYYADMVGQMLGTLGFDALVGGLPGAVAGSVVPVAGTAVGALAGVSAVNANAAMGRFAMRLDAVEAESGQKLDLLARFAATAGVGAVTGGANAIGIKSGGGAAAALIAEAAAAAAVKPGVGQALGRLALEAGKGGAVGAGLMSTMVATEAVLEDAAKAVSPGDYETLLNDPERRTKVLGDVTQAFADGFVLMGGLHALPAGRNFAVDTGLIRQAAAGKEGLQALMNVAEESATKKRDPETFAAFAARHGGETLTVVGEGAQVLSEGIGTVAADGARVIPMADYLALVDMETHRKIADDVQHGDGQLSVREGEELAAVRSAPQGHPAGENYLGENLPDRGLAPANVDGQGRIYVGPKGGLHFQIAEKFDFQARGVWADTGFVTPDGEFLNRQEALAWVEQNEKKVKPSENMGNELDAMDYREQVPNAQRKVGRRGDGGDNAAPASDTPPPRAQWAAPQAVEPDPVLAAAAAEMEGMYLQPLFPDAAAVGMAGAEFTRYSTLLEQRAEALRARSERKAARTAAEEQTPTYRAREDAVREEVEANVDDRPVMVADRIIRTGDAGEAGGRGSYRLDAALVDSVSRPGTADLLRGMVKRGGLHPDELAGMVGYGTGAELVQDLVGLKVERDRYGLSPKDYRERVIREDVRAKMLERFGDLPENIQREAREAAIMPAATEILNAEREFLAARAEVPEAASVADLRVAVAMDFAGKGAKEARDLAGYMRAVARAGRQAELALLRQDFAAAFDAKQRQQISHLYAEQAKAFVRTERKAGNWLRMYADNVKLEAVAQDYTNQVQGIAQRLGVEVRRDANDLAEVLREAGSLERFISGKNAELGGLIPDEPLPQKLLQDFSVQDTVQLHDLLQALDFQGRQEKKIQVAGEQLNLESLVAEGVSNIMSLPDRFDPNKAGMAAQFAKGSRRIDAVLLKMEQLFEWFDKHDSGGVFHRVVVEPLHKAQGLRDDLFTSLGKQLRALDQGKAWNKTLDNDLKNTTLMDPFDEVVKPLRITRKNMLSMMLNMGNEGNFQQLTKGMGWDPQAVRDFVNANATREDWNWVTGVWDAFKSLEPLVKKTYRELADVAPEMITPNEVVTPFGKFSGGYFPLIRDTLRAGQVKEGLSENLFQRGQIQPMPANGYTKARTGAVYALELNPELVSAYLRATAHDVAFRGAVIQANKFLMHPDIQRAVKRTFGPEYAAEFFPYLRDIANDGVSDVAGVAWISRAMAGARNATIASLIGLNPGTVAIHGMSAGFNSIGELAHQFGWKAAAGSVPKFVKVAGKQLAADAYTQTISRWTKNPAQFNKLWLEALDQSSEMRNRLHNFDRDLNIMQDRALGKKDRVAAWNSFATGFVAYGDLLTAVPTFITARDLAMANGKSLEEAIAIGNKTVRQAHGSAGITDRARIQRGGDFQKAFTMFYGYFSHNYNRNRNTWREVGEGKEQARRKQYADLSTTGLKVLTATVFYAILPALNHAWIRHPREEDDSWAKWFAGALTTQFSGTIPGVRDLGTAIVSGYDPVLTPLAGSVKSVATSANNALIAAGFKDEKIKHGAVANAVTTGGLVIGAGTRQIGKGAQFIYDVREGREHPEDFWDWWRGLTSGHVHERKHH